MKTLVVPEWDNYRHNNAQESHFDTLIDEPTLVYIENHSTAFAYYGLLPDSFESLGDSLLDAPFGVGVRATGKLTTRSVTFGYTQRAVMRSRDYAAPNTFNLRQPVLYEKVLGLAVALDEKFAELIPSQHEAQVDLLRESVCSDYHLKSTAFTGGILNLDCALNYHRDKGNFKDSWNIMGVWNKNTSGGVTVVAGPRLGFQMENNSYLLFPAQSNTHGVTEIVKHKRDAYRISAVMYAVEGLKHSLPLEEERARARVKRTEREQRRAGLIP